MDTNVIKCKIINCEHLFTESMRQASRRLCGYYPDTISRCYRWRNIDDFKLFIAIDKERRNVEKL